MAANGSAVVAWLSEDRRAVASRAADGTLSTLSLSSGGRPDRSQPTTVAIGKDGLAVAAWSDGTSVRAVVREPGGQWSAPEVVGSGGHPDAAVAPDGTIYLAIAAAASGQGIQVARRSPEGGWSLEQVPSGAIGHVPRMAVAGSFAIVTWRDGVAQSLRIRSSMRRDGVWQAAEDLPVPAGTFGVPSIALGDRGDALALWREQVPAGGALVQASHRLAAGPWGEAEELGAGPTAELPDVAFDATGNALAVWRGSVEGGQPPAVRVARFDAGSMTWVSRVDVARARLQGPPALGVGEAGDALVGWIGAGPRAAQGSSLTGRFAGPEQIRSGAGNPSPAGLIDLGVDGRGRAVAVWQEREKGNAYSLYLAARSAGGGGQVQLTAAQLRINQRISQAAIRRLNALEAMIEGRPPPKAGKSRSGTVALSIRQLRINQRISQAAVRRANRLEARLNGHPAPTEGQGGGGAIRLTARQLLINQRISQAAVRRANALEERVPELPVPRPAFGPDFVVGTTIDSRRFRVDDVFRGSLAEGTVLTLVSPPGFNPPFVKDQPLGADGLAASGVFYAFGLSLEPPPSG